MGYRYHNSMGAAIDSDSHNSILNFDKFYLNDLFKLNFKNVYQNNSTDHSLIQSI